MVHQMSGAKMRRSYHHFFSEAQLVSWNPMIVSSLFIVHLWTVLFHWQFTEIAERSLCCFISYDFRFFANLDSGNIQWYVDYELVFHYAESFLPCKVA
uniref:Uncharacterized protein n=1 Tax=Solanum lycopersicum TaxID=4081 RepID=A0A3Q7EUA1_SOLLC